MEHVDRKVICLGDFELLCKDDRKFMIEGVVFTASDFDGMSLVELKGNIMHGQLEVLLVPPKML